MSDLKLGEAIVKLEDMGWKIAHISQNDNSEWMVEARHSHITSFDQVIITPMDAGILPAVNEAIRLASAWAEVHKYAKTHGLKGKVTFS